MGDQKGKKEVKELVAVFHCDACGDEVKMIGTCPKTENSMFCPYCGSKKFYSYTDYYTFSRDDRKWI